MKIAIYDTHDFEIETLQRAGADRHQTVFLQTRLDEETAVLAKGAAAAMLFVHDKADANTLGRLSAAGVRFLLLRSAGYNHVDIKAAHKLGMRVARVPEYSPHAVAEHAVALMLALNRKIHRAYNRVRELNFSLSGLVGFDMNGKTAGIIGTGRIGKVTAKILKGFGMTVLAYDPTPDADLVKSLGVRYVSLDELLCLSHVITLHVPLTAATRYLINSKSIALMQPGVMLVNTSRGGLINTRDVIVALKSGRIGALGLDVYEEEDQLFFEDHSGEILQDDVIARLLTFPNVLITSHQGFLTKTALERIAETSMANANCFENDMPCPNEIQMA